MLDHHESQSEGMYVCMYTSLQTKYQQLHDCGKHLCSSSLIDFRMTIESAACSWCHGFCSLSCNHCVLYLMHMSLINDGVYQEGRMHQINNVHLIAFITSIILIADCFDTPTWLSLLRIKGHSQDFYSLGCVPCSKCNNSQGSIAPDYCYKRWSTDREAPHVYTQPEGIGT